MEFLSLSGQAFAIASRRPAAKLLRAIILSVVAVAAIVPATPSGARTNNRKANEDSDFAKTELLRCNKAGAGYRPVPANGMGSIKELAGLLRGTWVRRLSFGGSLIETNSFWYFDLPDLESGQGTAMMIDRVNQGWDSHEFGDRKASTKRDDSIGSATTGGFWKVKIEPAGDGLAIRGVSGFKLSMAGQYRGSAAEYPKGGFEFVESGMLFRTGDGYSTLTPWRAPPMAEAANQTSETGDKFTPVDAFIARFGAKARRPSLTFVLCGDGIVDRYYKISDKALPDGGGSLLAAWQNAVDSGIFDRSNLAGAESSAGESKR